MASLDDIMVDFKKDSKAVAEVTSLLAAVSVNDTRADSAAAIAALVRKEGVRALETYGIIEKLAADMAAKKNVNLNCGALATYEALAAADLCPVTQPYLMSALPTFYLLLADKQKPVAKAAEATIKAFFSNLYDGAVKGVLAATFAAFGEGKTWQSKVAALKLLAHLSTASPKCVGNQLPAIIPKVGEAMWDTKKDVKVQSSATLTQCISIIDNKDVVPFLPSLVACIAKPEQVPECVHTLGGTTFVASVDGPTLSITVPLLLRGLKERNTAVKRMSCVIINNMSKLVNDPTEAAPFIPELLPELTQVKESMSNPEARLVCERACEQLQRIQAAALVGNRAITVEGARAEFDKCFSGAKGMVEDALMFCAVAASGMADNKRWEEETWQKVLSPVLTPFVGDAKAAEVIKTVFEQCLANAAPEVIEEEADDAEELCNCTFTLAYGTKILLHNTSMRLNRGRRYGLLGGNDCGKTTLMRSIAQNQVMGFPPPDQVKTVFVEADIQGEISHLTCVDYILESPAIQALPEAKKSHEYISDMLISVGFSKKRVPSGGYVGAKASTLSGGWRMKLALARAMMLDADILLMDEPTNHLDVLNVKWVEDYLISLTNVTCILVSHSSTFLDRVCTNILQIQDLKLTNTKGNLSDFVKLHPEAMAFFELKSAKFKFKFPQPTFIEGVKSKGKALMKMEHCDYTYPTNTEPTIMDVSIQVSLSSRVACVGENGAGKSTLIKCLTGEVEPQTGTVWKHQGARVAYVAQHAFHHIEMHLNKTPNQYIQWRYQGGEDKETLNKVTLVLTDDEKAKMKKPFEYQWRDEDTDKIMKENRVIEKLTGERREEKRSGFEYEAKFVGKSMDSNVYLPQAKLEKLGWKKTCHLIDSKILARKGAYQRPLTQAQVEMHLEDIGLEKEYGSHYRMSALSGGQKVKVVIAAAMWMQPHILILDEPTNYLDRESLGALAGAIEDFDGGVVMITHNNEFCSALCPETWVMEAGHLETKGDAEWMKNALKAEAKFENLDEMVDGAGNVSKKKKKKELSRKEQRDKAKERKRRLKAGIELSDEDEDEWEAM